MLSPPEFDAVYLVDTEYQTGTGDRCKPICMVSRELYSGHVNRRWLWNCDPGTPPWNPRDPRTLVVSFSVPAECGVFAALGWEQPCRVHDLWAEHRLRTNGLTRATAFLNVLKSYGIPAPIQTDEKKAWQKLCGGQLIGDRIPTQRDHRLLRGRRGPDGSLVPRDAFGHQLAGSPLSR